MISFPVTSLFNVTVESSEVNHVSVVKQNVSRLVFICNFKVHAGEHFTAACAKLPEIFS